MSAHVFDPGLNASQAVPHGGEKQDVLTQAFLAPLLPELEAMFLAVREHLDPALSRQLPFRSGKPYPKGQCLEIANAVFRWLNRPDRSILTPKADRGYQAFALFRKNGGIFRRVWGDLRGRYFQNAFQLGTLYVDVANDSVVVTKPKIEILPFVDAGLNPITDFRHFIRIAESYWGGKFLPNHIVPDIAPYCPLVHVTGEGQFIFQSRSAFMIWLSVSQKFRHSENLLRDAPMPAEAFTRLREILVRGDFRTARSPASGRAAALAACDSYRRKRWHASKQQSNRILSSVGRINFHLGSQNENSPNRDSLPHSNGADTMQEPTMQQTITINGTSYPVESLPPGAQEQFASIQVVDRKIQELKQELAILQTARNAYARALTDAVADMEPQT